MRAALQLYDAPCIAERYIRMQYLFHLLQAIVLAYWRKLLDRSRILLQLQGLACLLTDKPSVLVRFYQSHQTGLCFAVHRMDNFCHLVHKIGYLNIVPPIILARIDPQLLSRHQIAHFYCKMASNQYANSAPNQNTHSVSLFPIH